MNAMLSTCIPSYMMTHLQHGHLQKKKKAEWETLTYRTIKLSNKDKITLAEQWEFHYNLMLIKSKTVTNCTSYKHGNRHIPAW